MRNTQLMSHNAIYRIVTGSPNEQLKVWSYNSGECLKTLDKGECYSIVHVIHDTIVCILCLLCVENKKEVTRARFVSVNQNKYVCLRTIYTECMLTHHVYIC